MGDWFDMDELVDAGVTMKEVFEALSGLVSTSTNLFLNRNSVVVMTSKGMVIIREATNVGLEVTMRCLGVEVLGSDDWLYAFLTLLDEFGFKI